MNLHNKFLIANSGLETGTMGLCRAYNTLCPISTSILAHRFVFQGTTSHTVYFDYVTPHTTDTLGILALDLCFYYLPLNGDHQLFELCPLTYWIEYCLLVSLGQLRSLKNASLVRGCPQKTNSRWECLLAEVTKGFVRWLAGMMRYGKDERVQQDQQ